MTLLANLVSEKNFNHHNIIVQFDIFFFRFHLLTLFSLGLYIYINASEKEVDGELRHHFERLLSWSAMLDF